MPGSGYALADILDGKVNGIALTLHHPFFILVGDYQVGRWRGQFYGHAVVVLDGLVDFHIDIGAHRNRIGATVEVYMRGEEYKP